MGFSQGWRVKIDTTVSNDKQQRQMEVAKDKEGSNVIWVLNGHRGIAADTQP